MMAEAIVEEVLVDAARALDAGLDGVVRGLVRAEGGAAT